MRRVTTLCCGAAALMMLSVSRRSATAASDDPRELIEGTGVCPEPRAVWSSLSGLGGGDRLERALRGLPGPGAPVAITDLGASFRVRAGDHARAYQDEARDCAHRAELAAVFVALAVDSLEQTAQATASPPVPPPPVTAVPPVAPAEPATKSPFASLELGVDGRSGVAPWTAAPGGLARIAVGQARFALVAGVRGSAPAEATMAGVRVRQWRAAADLSLRGRWLQDGPVTVFADLGAVAARLSAQAPDLAVSGAHAAGALGVIAGGGVHFHRRSWGSAFLLVEAELFPDPPTASALPTGPLGRTPYLWLGAAAGLSLRLR